MAADLRLPLVVAAAVALFGLALGAETQEEQFLHKDLEEAKAYLADSQASGNLIILTSVLAAAGATACLVLVSRQQWRVKATWAPVFFAAAWTMIVLVQSTFPQVLGILDSRQASLALAPATVHAPALPTVLLPVLATLLAAGLATGFTARRLLQEEAPPRWTLREARRRHVGVLALVLPFLAVTMGAHLRILLVLPATGEPGVGLQYILSPVAASAAMGLIITYLLRHWSLASASRNPRIVPVSREAWHVMARVEWFFFAALAAVALASTALPALDISLFSAGHVFGLSLRSHGQATLFLAIPLAVAWLTHQHIQRLLDRNEPRTAGTDSTRAMIGDIVATAGLAVAALAGGITALTLTDTLVPYLVAAAIAGAVALRHADPYWGLAPLLLAGLALWGIGNTVIADFNSNANPPLVMETEPGVLAVWRFLAVVAVGAGVARLALHVGRHEKAVAAIPSTVAVAAAAAFIPLLEFSFGAWVITSQVGDAIAIGNLVTAQDASVRFTMHGLALGLSTVGALGAARLLRPDWFGDKATAADAPRPADAGPAKSEH